MCRRRRSRSSTSVVSLQGIKKRNLCVSRPQDKPCVGPSLCSSLSSGWATRGLRTAECPFVGFHYLHKQSFRTSKQQQQHHDSTKATECEITASSCYSVLSGAVYCHKISLQLIIIYGWRKFDCAVYWIYYLINTLNSWTQATIMNKLAVSTEFVFKKTSVKKV